MMNSSKYTYFCILLLAIVSCSNNQTHFTYSHGAIVRGDTTTKRIALVFTGDEFGDGGTFISETLEKEKIKASFFLTGNFYRNKEFGPLISKLIEDGNYLGSHSDRHLLYCDWTNRDSLLVNRKEFINDLDNSFNEMAKFGIKRTEARYFMPPYEWYNDSIAAWTDDVGLQLVNFTVGTRSNADYTFPAMGNQYVDSKTIHNSIISCEQQSLSGLNGFILLTHIGTDPGRTDKFYFYLPQLIMELKSRGYLFVRINELLN
jgi:peptidoglycan/xylan/chitin deacetylase (PgdA/CDA1 family)